MLTLNQLTAIANADHVDVRTVERDYLLTHLIERLSSLPDSDALTFTRAASRSISSVTWK